VATLDDLVNDFDMNEPTEHYDQEYFLGHYGRLINDGAYYELLARYWKKAVFGGVNELEAIEQMRVLDYGCGTGVVTAALSNSCCFDVSPYALKFLDCKGRETIGKSSEIPRSAFDVLVCSHSLEHYTNPFDMLKGFRDYLRPSGYLVLVLPIEHNYEPTISADGDQHLYGWTFQSITNLLLLGGWRPCAAATIYGPFLLGSLGRKLLPAGLAVSFAHSLGRIKRGFASMRIVSRLG
jgi:2-polyprenyl-3-methyl-5-hydroxy-6-metoxy-1,4-benzoquinol methylase